MCILLQVPVMEAPTKTVLCQSVNNAQKIPLAQRELNPALHANRDIKLTLRGLSVVRRRQ